MSVEPEHPIRPLKRPIQRARKSTATRLKAALLTLTGQQGHITSHSQRAWASITFTGARYNFTLQFIGQEAIDAGEALIAILPEHEFSIPRKIVADATIISVDHTITPEPKMVVECELLLLNDA